MTSFLYAEINIIGSVVLLLFLNNIYRNKAAVMSLDQQIFNICLFLNVLIYLFDTGMWVFDGKTGDAFVIFNNISSALYYMFNPIISYVWLLYTDYKIYESRSGLIKRGKIYFVPIIITTVMSILSPFTKWYFVIDSDNHYSRGDYFYIMALVSLIYLLYAVIISVADFVKNGFSGKRIEVIHIIFFTILVIVSVIIQTAFFGVTVIWISTMLAFTSIYINIQNGRISTDHLTGLYNRCYLDLHLEKRIINKKTDSLLFVIVLDLDDFKNINDSFGHSVGDKALIKMADILRRSSENTDNFISRMGGDEFVIVGESKSEELVINFISKIEELAENINQNEKAEYRLRTSAGYSIYKQGDKAEYLLVAADKKMYIEKQKRKN